MGGLGSGRDDYATTATVGRSDTLAVNELGGVLDEPGLKATVTWQGGRDRSDRQIGIQSVATASSETNPMDEAPDDGGGRDRGDGGDLDGDTSHPDDGNASSGANAKGGDLDGVEDRDVADRPGWLRLGYRVGDDEIRDDVAIEYTPCNFGGVRPWFRCPSCDSRRAKLHRPPAGSRFRCRECHELGYLSARTAGDDVTQARLRFQRIHEKIDGTRPHPSNYLTPPDRPKGMHESTYTALTDDLRAAFEAWDDAFLGRLESLSDRLDGDVGLL
jgi:hypothetical protein